jgi:hypothetical protein
VLSTARDQLALGGLILERQVTEHLRREEVTTEVAWLAAARAAQSLKSSDADSPRRTPAWFHIGKPTLKGARCENSNATSTDASVRTQ